MNTCPIMKGLAPILVLHVVPCDELSLAHELPTSYLAIPLKRIMGDGTIYTVPFDCLWTVSTVDSIILEEIVAHRHADALCFESSSLCVHPSVVDDPCIMSLVDQHSTNFSIISKKTCSTRWIQECVVHNLESWIALCRCKLRSECPDPPNREVCAALDVEEVIIMPPPETHGWLVCAIELQKEAVATLGAPRTL